MSRASASSNGCLPERSCNDAALFENRTCCVMALEEMQQVESSAQGRIIRDCYLPHLPEQRRPQPRESSMRRPSGSPRSSQRWKSTQPAQSTPSPRLAQRYPHTAQAALNRPAKPMKAMDRMPAIMRLIAVPRISLGTGAVSDSSRSPAMSTRARVKPSPAPRA